MFEAAALCSAHLAFALLHAADPQRRPRGLAGLVPGSAHLFRAAALAALAWSVVCWARAEDTTAALLVALAALCTSATLFVLLVRVFPRLMWAAALACAPAALLLPLLGRGS